MTASDVKAGGRRKAPLDAVPDLVSHRQVAAKLQVTPHAIRARVKAGKWPLPYLVSGALWYWRESDVVARLNTGSWPAGMTFRGGS